MFQNDYILREIENLTRFLANAFFHRSQENEQLIDEDGVVSGDGLFLHRLLQMVSEGRINDAEDLLHEQIRLDPRREYLAVAIRFYEHLGRLTEDRLEECDFSPQEIVEGLEDIKQIYLGL